MAETLNSQLSILNFFRAPEECLLGKRVYKKLFHENAKLSSADKKALADDVDTIVWQYTFKPSTIPIQPYEDDQREYTEIVVLQAILRNIKRYKRIIEIIHRAIPYPTILELRIKSLDLRVKGEKTLNSQLSTHNSLLSLAQKRFSQAEKDAIVAEGFQATRWLNLSNPTENQAAFLESLDISTWPHTHFFAFYKAAMDRVIALACAEHTGHYSLPISHGISVDERVIKLDQLEKLQQEKSELAGKLKKEKNLGTQVQLNTEIREIMNRIEEIKREL